LGLSAEATSKRGAAPGLLVILCGSADVGRAPVSACPCRGPVLDQRQPTLSWPRQIPVDGEPAETFEIVSDYGSWLSGSTVPKLFINADPGRSLKGAQREFCRTWRNQTEVTVSGLHFVQEDSPDQVGEAVALWHRDL
jgi:hypothetical protein